MADVSADVEEGAADAESEEHGDGWVAAPEPLVFRDVRFRQRLLRPLHAAGSAPGPRPRHGPVIRSSCVVHLEQAPAGAVSGEEAGGATASSSTSRVFEFRLGDRHGLARQPGMEALLGSAWRPPAEARDRVDVEPWVTEAVLGLQVGQSAEFAPATSTSCSIDKGPSGLCRLHLLEACDTQDLLGDGGIVLRLLESDPAGKKPRDLARVRASWRAWFARSGEDVVAVPGGSMPTPSILGIEGVELVIDEGRLMLPLEMALKEMPCGSRALLRVSEEWGSGALTPEGNPVLSGAAIWAEIRLHAVENEMGPGEHETVDAAVAFALEKKLQGNDLLRRGATAPVDVARAARRYEAGMRILEAALAPPGSSSGRTAACAGVEEGGGSDAARASASAAGAVAALRALQLNCAQAELKLKRWRNAVTLCDAVLRREPGNSKARYRRALAKVELADLAGALDDLRAAASLLPGDAGVRKALAQVEGLLREHQAVEKKRFGGVFEKMRREEEALATREKKEGTTRRAEEKRGEAEKEAAMAEMFRKCEAAKAARGGREAARAAAEEAAGRGASEGEAEAPEAPPASTAPEALAAAAAPGKDDDLVGTEFKKEALKVSAADQAILDKVTAGETCAPMLPSNLRDRMKTVEPAAPVEYTVPSFLRVKPKKKQAS